MRGKDDVVVVLLTIELGERARCEGPDVVCLWCIRVALDVYDLRVASGVTAL